MRELKKWIENRRFLDLIDQLISYDPQSRTLRLHLVLYLPKISHETSGIVKR